MGAICYLDPHRCGNQKFNDGYKLKKWSDIYSLGVIFWQIFSGHQPFEEEKRNLDVKGLWNLFNQILNGKREIAAEKTPQKFIQLYEDCWKTDFKSRPTISKVVQRIQQILEDDGISN